MLKNFKGEIVLKKRVLSGLLAIALIFGSAAALPEGVFTQSTSITASALASGDIVYEVRKASDGHEFAMVTAFTDESGTKCVIPDELPGTHGDVPVEVIAEGAFKDNTNLQIVEVPLSLRSIANSAFEGCTALTVIDGFRITNLKYIGDNAFKGCTSLKTLSFPETLETIGKSAFEGCASFKNVTIPSYVEKISQSAFKDCTNLLSVTFSDDCFTTTISYDAFMGCTSLYKVTLSKYIETIGAQAFENCSRLESITIPDNVKNIYFGTFKGCSNLTSVTIPDGVERIDAYAFTDCENLKRIKIPKSVKTFGYNNTTKITPTYDEPICDKDCTIICRPGSEAEQYAKGKGNKIQYYYGDYVYKVLADGTVEITEYLGKDTEITIPSTIDDKKVSSIGERAFSSCSSLTSITIPKSVKSIGYEAFADCTKLKSVTIQNGVTSIGTRAFKGCESLTSVTIPKSVTSVGHNAFVDCPMLTSVTIPKSVTKIGEYAFGYDTEGMQTDGFTIYCVKGSAAENYAKDKGFKFEYIDVTHVAAKAPTCTTDGNIEYWKYGNKYYSDKELTKQIDESKIVIKATGHKWGEPTWTWDGVKAATAKFVCGNNSKHVETFTAKITSNTTKAATCTTDGKAVYTATVTLDGKTYTDKKTVTIKKLGHKYGEPTWTWDGTKTATAKFVCARDKSHVETVTVKITSKTTKATCEKDGKTVYTATVPFNGKTYTNTNTVTIPKTGHSWSKWTTTKKATCTADGSKTRTCSVCKKTETATIAKFGHDYKTTVVKPTCTAKGYTLHKCSRCGDSYKDTYKDATGHKWSKWTTTKKATCTADGSKTRTCSVCKKTETATIAKLGHDYKATVVKPTCTAKGYTLHKCSRCGDSYKDTYKDATGHSWSKWTTTKKATCTTDGTQTRKCSVCGKTETKTIKATGHKLTATPAKAATCTTNGNKAYWYCSTCKKYFSDKNGKTAITKTSTVVKKKGHKFTAWKTTSFNVDKGTSTQKHTCSVCKKPETRTVKNAVVRYAGANRYDTAAMLSKASHKTTSGTVIIADAMTFQDALIAVPLAKAYNAPLLLANSNIVTKQTEAELARLKAKKVIIVNTNKALKKGTLDALKKKYTTQIISGNNCFETSKRVAEELQKKTKKAPTDVFFTTNKAFADALSISPVAALKGAPILYVDPSKKTLDSNILAYLNKVKGSIKNVYIVGGTVAVPKAIENSIKKALPKKNVTRFDGAQRYETCVMINKYFAKDLSSKTVCIAKGLDFPDALAGGVFAANQKAPLLLADSALRDAHKSFLKDKKPNKLYIFGGKVAVPDKLAKEVAKMSV